MKGLGEIDRSVNKSDLIQIEAKFAIDNESISIRLRAD